MNALGMPTPVDVSSAEGVAADELKPFSERLEEEKAGIASDLHTSTKGSC